jgi:hypothetical protein
MMPNHRLTREQQRKGGANWGDLKRASVGRIFEEFNDKQRAAAQARYDKIKLLRENGLTWPDVATFLGESEASLKAVYYRLRARFGDPVIPTPPQTHCKNRHELTGDNLYVHNGLRGCRTCRSAAGARARQRRREAG